MTRWPNSASRTSARAGLLSTTHDLLVALHQRARHVGADLPAADDDREHQPASPSRRGPAREPLDGHLHRRDDLEAAVGVGLGAGRVLDARRDVGHLVASASATWAITRLVLSPSVAAMSDVGVLDAGLLEHLRVHAVAEHERVAPVRAEPRRGSPPRARPR